jgi:acyl-coenzyme A synthetase/AMP-(fatty) acid ligase
MMRGYWARPDLNATAFVRKEMFAGFEKVFYRTGDIVRERGDGNLVFLGRKDRQIKVRGYRVELDEVENVVGSLPEVAEAAAVSVRRGENEIDIAAAVILRDGVAVDADGLRRSAAGKLSIYSVPSRIDVRHDLPRTATGKIDRRALAEEYENAARGGPSGG